jgi:hypothetical protein
MGKAAMVFRPTRREVLYQVLTGLRIKAIEVLRGKRTQPQLRLLEPRGRRGRVEYSQSRPARAVALGVLRNMGAPIVHNEMTATGFGVAPFDLAHAPQEMVMIIFVQTPSQPRPGVMKMAEAKRQFFVPTASIFVPVEKAGSGGSSGVELRNETFYSPSEMSGKEAAADGTNERKDLHQPAAQTR